MLTVLMTVLNLHTQTVITTNTPDDPIQEAQACTEVHLWRQQYEVPSQTTPLKSH